MSQIQRLQVKPEEIHAIVGAVIVQGAKPGVVPIFKITGEHDIQLHMHMRAALVDPCARVAHLSNGLTCGDLLADGDFCFLQMGIEREEGSLTPVVLDDDVTAVIASS